MRSRGAQLVVKDEVLTAKVTASDRPAELGTQDLIIVTVKGTALAGVAASVSELLGPETSVLSAMNGVPWWFFHGLPGAMANASLPSVDAGGAISAAIPPNRVLGCVVHASCSVTSAARLAAGSK